MLSSQEQSAIRQLMQSPQWPALQHLADKLCLKIITDSKLRNSQWETLKKVLTDIGQIDGIKRFLQELVNQAKQ